MCKFGTSHFEKCCRLGECATCSAWEYGLLMQVRKLAPVIAVMFRHNCLLRVFQLSEPEGGAYFRMQSGSELDHIKHTDC